MKHIGTLCFFGPGDEPVIIFNGETHEGFPYPPTECYPAYTRAATDDSEGYFNPGFVLLDEVPARFYTMETAFHPGDVRNEMKMTRVYCRGRERIVPSAPAAASDGLRAVLDTLATIDARLTELTAVVNASLAERRRGDDVATALKARLFDELARSVLDGGGDPYKRG